jgi:cysteine synthase
MLKSTPATVKGITFIIFSLADNVHELVKQALKIEVQKLDSQAKDRVARAMIARIER